VGALIVAIVAFIGVLGMLIGSFLNVVVWRLPRKESLSHPPSACPKCGHAIRWWDNIPVLSWLILRGRCRDCGDPISARYPLVELATGLFFVAVAVSFIGPVDMPTIELAASVLTLAAFLYLAGVSVALALIDIDTHTLPNKIVLPSYVVGIVLLTAAAIQAPEFDSLARAGISMAILFVAYLLLALFYPGGSGMGFGDVKLAGVLGLYLGWLGWGPLLVGAFGAFLLGGVFSLGLLALRRVNRKSGIPFGPWMLGGAWLGIFFGEALWRSYLSLFGLA
jgi:leader peptidase (prepilin peptidase)/N-methyltransferase